METLVQADIFFFITSVAVIVLSVLFAVALVYAIRVLKDAQHVSSKLREQTEHIMRDVDDARLYFRKEGARLTAVAGVLGRLFKSGKRKKRDAGEE